MNFAIWGITGLCEAIHRLLVDSFHVLFKQKASKAESFYMPLCSHVQILKNGNNYTSSEIERRKLSFNDIIGNLLQIDFLLSRAP